MSYYPQDVNSVDRMEELINQMRIELDHLNRALVKVKI